MRPWLLPGLSKYGPLKDWLRVSARKCLSAIRRYLVHWRDLLRPRTGKIDYSDGGRDSITPEVDNFAVVLDSFKDRQNGFVFSTTPGAVQFDGQVVKGGVGGFRSGGRLQFKLGRILGSIGASK